MQRKWPYTIAFSLMFLFCLIGCSPEDGADGLNGADGINGENGLNSLITTLVEQPGSNCPNGGFVIHLGLDSNANGVLEANEIKNTEYLCNSYNTDIAYKSYVSLDRKSV